MQVLKVARVADISVGVVCTVVGSYWLSQGSYLCGGLAVLSAVVSFASAKYVPAGWVAKRILLARLK